MLRRKKNFIIAVILGLLALIGGTVLLLSVSHKKVIQFDTLDQYKNIVPVAVIGSGPAGLSAAMYTARAKLPTIIFEGDNPGGQLMEASYIENWPGKKKMPGAEAIEDLENQAHYFGARRSQETIASVDFSTWPFTLVTDKGDEIKALVVIAATGGRQKKLDVPGVEEFWGKGIHVCTICDAPFDRGKDVAIVGGGDSSVDYAMQLAQFAKKVYLLVRSDTMQAAAFGQDYLKKYDNVEVKYNVELKKVNGENDALTTVDLYNNKTNQPESLKVQSLYFALGFEPNSELFQGHLPMDAERYVKVVPGTQRTLVSGIFAAGNIQDPYYQKAGAATGSGVKAGIDAIEFLQRHNFNHRTTDKIADQLYQPKKEFSEITQEVTTVKSVNNAIESYPRVVVLFYGKECDSCSRMKDDLATLVQNTKDLTVLTVNSDKAKELVGLYKIEQTPTLLLIQRDAVLKRSTEALDKNDLIQFIEVPEKS